MKKILYIFFVTLGVIFFGLILIGSYLFIFDPYNIKPLFKGLESDTNVESESESEFVLEPELESEIDTEDVMVDKNPILNETQEKTLETFGIDPAKVPSEITPEQEECFREQLGDGRVDEIISGDSPTITEYFKARNCI